MEGRAPRWARDRSGERVGCARPVPNRFQPLGDGPVAAHDGHAPRVTARGVTHDPVDIARRACEAGWRRPKPDYATVNALAHPDHELFTVQSLVEGGSYRGAEGFRRWLESWRELFGEDWQCALEDAAAIADNRVLITARVKARGLGGGVPVDQGFWMVMSVRDGKLTRTEVYTDRERALEAAGVVGG
jgi:ketosteroid isomerase-like protein